MSGTGSSSGQKKLPQVLGSAPAQEDPEELLDDKDINVRDPLIPVCDLHIAIKSVLELSAHHEHLSIPACKRRGTTGP